MAALPFHYYLDLRGDWIRSNTIPSAEDDASGGFVEPVDDVLGTYNAQSLIGGMV